MKCFFPKLHLFGVFFDVHCASLGRFVTEMQLWMDNWIYVLKSSALRSCFLEDILMGSGPTGFPKNNIFWIFTQSKMLNFTIMKFILIQESYSWSQKVKMQLLSTNLVSAFLQLGQGFVHVRSNQFLQKKEEKNLLLRLALSFPYSFPCITFMFPADCILVFMSRPEPCTTHQFLIQYYGNLDSNRL